MNSVNLIGRLTKDFELRYTSGNNTAVGSSTLAVDDGFGDKKKTYFFPLTAWGKTAENMSKFFTKGDLVGISGRMTQRSWEDDKGKHTITDITVESFSFCGSKKSEGQPSNNNGDENGFFPVDESDDLPF